MRRVKISNLKEMAKTVCFVQEHGFDSLEQLAEKYNELKEHYTQAKEKLEQMNQEVRTRNIQIHGVGLYYANKETQKAFLTARNKKKFQREHLQELEDYRKGVQFIKDHFEGVVPSLKGLKKQRDELYEERDRQHQACDALKASIKELEIAQKNIEAIFENDPIFEQIAPVGKEEKTTTVKTPKSSVLDLLREKQQIVDERERQK